MQFVPSRGWELPYYAPLGVLRSFMLYGTIRQCNKFQFLEVCTEMAESTLEILDKLLSLPKGECEFIAVRLIDSLDEDDEVAIEKAWIEEAKRRVAEIDAGTVICRPFDEAIAEF